MAVKQLQPKELNVRVKDSDQFYSNEISINVSPVEFILDFKCVTQLQDVAKHSALLLRHNPVIITPYHAKNLLELLTRALKDYESKFGKIDKAKAIKKAEKLMEKEKKSTKDKKANVKLSAKPENYFG